MYSILRFSFHWIIVVLLVCLFSLSAYSAVVINEVRPWAGTTGVGTAQASQIELFNNTLASQNMSTWFLQADAIVLALPAVVLPPGGYLLIIFDNGTDDFDFTDGTGTWYAGPIGSLDRTGGEIGLFNAFPAQGSMVDFMNWGEGGSLFGIVYTWAVARGIWTSNTWIDIATYSAFSHTARLPSGYDTNTASDWQELEQQYCTPFSWDNPIQSSPEDGSIQGNVDQLTWRPINGATDYLVEVDDDPTFATPNLSQITTNTYLPIALAIGRYFWRVNARGIGTHPRAARSFTIGDVMSATYGYTSVPQYYQHKDSRLLCIMDVGPMENGGAPRRGGCTELGGANGPWDNAHPTGGHITRCGHCRNYCTRASIQMVNAKYGGSLLQDEISYHLHFPTLPGPEGDLGHGKGAWPNQNNGYSWAMNNAAITEAAAQLPWNTLTAEINAGRPILSVIQPPGWFHSTVANGYSDLFGSRSIHLMDPWPGRSRWWEYDRLPIVRYYVLQGTPTGRATDPNTTQDSDGDGVVDFDEGQQASEQPPREFCSDYQKDDTDGDEVKDKQEIRSYTFHDKDHGHDNDALNFADIDGDGLRQECDCDGDNDSDFDGGEDINGDGKDPIGGMETCEYTAGDYEIGTNLIILPGPWLCTADVYLFGQTFHENSWYPVEIIHGCPPPQDGDALSPLKRVNSTTNGVIYPQFLGTFSWGLYRVVTDVLRDNLYSEPDNWDPWQCFIVGAHIFIIITPPSTPTPVPVPTPTYTTTLDSLGLHYDVFIITPGMDGPSLWQLMNYYIVIWATTNRNDSTMTSTDASNLIVYLNNGGKLLITGQGFGNDVMMHPDPMKQQLYNQYLGAQWVQDIPMCQTVNGNPGTFLSPFQNVPITSPMGYPDFAPDDILAAPFSTPIWSWPPDMCPTMAGCAGTATADMAINSRAVYFSYCWETIPEFEVRTAIMDSTLKWLYGTRTAPPAVTDLVIYRSGIGMELKWSPVTGAFSYNVYASDQSEFTPDETSLIGSVGPMEEPCYFDPDGGLLPHRFYCVTSVGGEGHSGTEMAARKWMAGQSEPDVIDRELERRHIPHQIISSEPNHKPHEKKI